MFNKVIIIGNLARDVELKYLPSGMAIGSGSIANTQKWKDKNTNEMKEDTCFIDFKIFGKSAESLNPYMKKGKKFLLEGRLTQESWTDQNGQKRNKHSILVDKVDFMDSNSSNNTENDNNIAQIKQNQTQTYTQPTSSVVEDSDIPF